MSRASRWGPLSCGMMSIIVATVSLADASTIWASMCPSAALAGGRTAMRPSLFGTVARRRGGSMHSLTEHAEVEVVPVAVRCATEDVLGRHAQEVGVDDLKCLQGFLVAREPSVMAVLQR